MYLPFYPIPASRVGCDRYSKEKHKKKRQNCRNTHSQFRGSHTLNFRYDFGVYRTSYGKPPRELAKLHPLLTCLRFHLRLLFEFSKWCTPIKKMYKNNTSNCCRCRADLGLGKTNRSCTFRFVIERFLLILI